MSGYELLLRGLFGPPKLISTFQISSLIIDSYLFFRVSVFVLSFDETWQNELLLI